MKTKFLSILVGIVLCTSLAVAQGQFNGGAGAAGASGTVSGQTNGFLPLATGTTTIGAASLCDQGITTANVLTCTDAGGITAPSFKASGSTAGYFLCVQGSANGHATANSITEECPAAVTAFEYIWPGTAASGLLDWTNAASVVTGSVIVPAQGTMLVGTSASAISFSVTPTLGIPGTSNGTLELASSTATGGIILSPASAASVFTVTIPAATDTLVNLAGTQSLTNKSLALTETNSGLTSGGVACATSTTAFAMTAALTSNVLFKGGGAGACGSNSSITDDAKNITTSEVFSGGNKVFVTSDFTDSTSASLQLITGLSYTLPTSKAANYSFHCGLMYDQASAAVVDQFGVGVTGTAPTNLSVMGVVEISASTFTAGNLQNLASTTPTSVVQFTPSAATTIWEATLDGTIEQPSNATPGVFSVYAFTTTGTDNFIVKRGSYCSVF